MSSSVGGRARAGATRPIVSAGAASIAETCIGVIMLATPTMERLLKMLLPSSVPTPTSWCPRMRDMIAVASSGVDVPIATSVAPMTNSLSPNCRATSAAP